MNIIKKLLTAARGGTRETLETVVDANALRILEQEILDAQKDIGASKQQLAAVIADKTKLARKLDALKGGLAKQEARVQEKLAASDEERALALAERVAETESRIKALQTAHDKLDSYEQNLMRALQQAVDKLEGFRNDLHLAKATQNSQAIVSQLSDNAVNTNSSLNSIQSSVDRIRQRQRDFQDKVDAMSSIENTLNAEAENPTKERAAAVLARLKSTPIAAG